MCKSCLGSTRPTFWRWRFCRPEPLQQSTTNGRYGSCCSGGLRPLILEHLLVAQSAGQDMFSKIRVYSSRFPVMKCLGSFENDGMDSSVFTHGNLSSRNIAFCGANGVGSLSDAIVKSIVSESLLSSKNKCVPQHAADERIRLAYGILRGSPFVTTR